MRALLEPVAGGQDEIPCGIAVDREDVDDRACRERAIDVRVLIAAQFECFVTDRCRYPVGVIARATSSLSATSP
jgi:hypothetical protein